MLKSTFSRYLILPIFLFSFLLHGNAKDIPAKSNQQIYDLASVLNTSEVEYLQKLLKDWQDSTSIEMAIVLDNSLEMKRFLNTL